MMRCTQTLILFLTLLLTNCMATPTSPVRTSETMATVTLAVTATPRPAPTVTVSVTVPAMITATATATVTATTVPTPTPSVTATHLPTRQPSPAPPTATATPEPPAVTLTANANLRAGPSTAYPVIGAGLAGQVLAITGQAAGDVFGRPITWWRTVRGWVAGFLVTANAAARIVPIVTDMPPPPIAEAQAEVRAEPTPTPTSTSTLTLTSASPQPDLVVLGPDTQYPVRARVIRGWDYEFADASTQYDIVVYRDVFGMLAHQIDDDNVQRYKGVSRFAASGPIRITLIDAQPHPDPGCPGWGWAPDRDTFVDPLGMSRKPCRVEHSLFPTGDGAGATLLMGWGYNAGTTLAVGAAGPTLADLSTTVIADLLPRPLNIGYSAPDYSQPLYRALGQARREGERWVWSDPFVQIVPDAR
jgi:hypothetical protein